MKPDLQHFSCYYSDMDLSRDSATWYKQDLFRSLSSLCYQQRPGFEKEISILKDSVIDCLFSISS